jgi:chitinase
VPFDKSQQLTEGKWDSIADSVDVCDGRIVQVVDGVLDFWELIDDGFLTKDGTVAKGIDYTFDQCSQTVCDLQRVWNHVNH